MTLALAVDLGGTKVEAAIVDDDGVIVPGTRHRAPTGEAAAGDAGVARESIETVVRRALAAAPAPVTAAGIGAAGPVDAGAGTTSPINLPALRDFPIAEVVARASGLDRVRLGLDGSCIALAERWRGAARACDDAIVLVVSTGVGGGVIVDGRLLGGASGNAGHLGQLVIEPFDGDPAPATVERIASGPHTVRWARERGWAGSTGEELAAAYAAGDPLATEAVRRSAAAVGVGIANAATLLDLELAVVGGGFAQVAQDYVDLVQASARDAAQNAYAARIRVERAQLGGEAPLIGAAALVLLD
ncbi:ROK family protein [Arenivirga flava]|uniref:ROK family protein n=1 Tax=Arenivirga flava TaxID=1930060 RepID=A0AA37UJ69_9MICO|nr:ROK family protein [Arenivirga flava]GMA27920.1 hypothetical protein GCM10025874_11730 [Arenivirga flava]